MTDKLARAKELLADRAATAPESAFVYINSAGKRCPRPKWLHKKPPASPPANVRQMRRTAGK